MLSKSRRDLFEKEIYFGGNQKKSLIVGGDLRFEVTTSSDQRSFEIFIVYSLLHNVEFLKNVDQLGELLLII